jgi:hypothetical protein
VIYITADTHHCINFQKIVTFDITHKNLTKSDYLIVAGDFGIPWGGVNKEDDEYLLNYIDKLFKPTLLFVDGNHCNFNLLH